MHTRSARNPEPDSAAPQCPAHLRPLNPAQRAAAEYGATAPDGCGPLLVIAGAGTGKTSTLAHRVAHLVSTGASPQRILLLTFSRRAAVEMARRVRTILGRRGAGSGAGMLPGTAGLPWSGTFHATGNRLLRIHAERVGLDPNFTVLDRADAADLLNLVRAELGLASSAARFPRKDTCLAIYSLTVNAQCALAGSLERSFPWCLQWHDELNRLFAGYVEAKQRHHVLDLDDLLLYWAQMMESPALARSIGERFDHVLVDEYQDTNALQARILLHLKPDGRGLTVVGDDAQAIYSFRAATVRNILEFPSQFSPAAHLITLEHNYRSSTPILEACNAVIGEAGEGYRKQLRSDRTDGERPTLMLLEDEAEQAVHVAERALELREAGIPLQRQAVLFRTAHHSDLLEIELSRRRIPFVKYGGLRFLEAAHIKDVLCVLRWVENPRDAVAAFRVLQLLPGVGPVTARTALQRLSQGDDWSALSAFTASQASAAYWRDLCTLLATLARARNPWSGPPEIAQVRRWYQPHLERVHEDAAARCADLDQLEQLAAGYPTRAGFLTELTLDPPEATSAPAGPPQLDEDYLVLSTIHSAKGLEWDAVFVLNVTDGCIPSDMAAGSNAQLEEERRLLYVAMTRARLHLQLLQPLRYFRSLQQRHGDGHVLALRSRFLPEHILGRFQRVRRCRDPALDAAAAPAAATTAALAAAPEERLDLAAKMREMWK